MRSPDGKLYVSSGVVTEARFPERIAVSHTWEQNEVEPKQVTTVVTMTLSASAGQTEMRFEQTGPKGIESRESHRGGWSEALDHLELETERISDRQLIVT